MSVLQIAPRRGPGDAGQLRHVGQGQALPAGIEGLDHHQALLQARHEVAIAACPILGLVTLHLLLPTGVCWTLVALTPLLKSYFMCAIAFNVRNANK